jgi:hypothetical protein
MKHLLATAIVFGLAPVAAAEIKVSYAPEFSEKLTEDYGTREGERLSERVTRDVTRAFEAVGVAPARVEVEIVDAKPSKPTFKQGADTPGLDIFRSVGIGGMELKGVAYDAAGNVISQTTYDWYETDIRQAGLTTWHDAHRASSRFARRFAKAAAN